MLKENYTDLSFLDGQYNELTMEELYDTTGGAITIVIAGVTFAGWKAVCLIAAGVTTVAGAIGLGIWNGYNDTKK